MTRASHHASCVARALFLSVAVLTQYLIPAISAAADPPAPKPDDSVIQVGLPAKFDDVCIGGGGRYLILRMLDQSELVVFDVREGRVVGTIPTGRPQAPLKAPFTAGQDTVIVANANERKLQSFDLATTKRRGPTADLDPRLAPHFLVMGYGSTGPVVFGAGVDSKVSHFAVYDSQTLQSLDYTITQPGRILPRGNITVHTNMAGTLGYIEPTTTSATIPRYQITIADRRVIVTDMTPGNTSPIQPFLRISENGEWLFRRPAAVSSISGEKIDAQSPSGTLLPAVQGPLLLDVVIKKETRQESPRYVVSANVGIYAPGIPQPLVELANLDLGASTSTISTTREAPLPGRIYYIPDENALVLLPVSDDAVIIRKLDLAAELAAAGKDVVVVSSSPPPRASLDQPWQYAIKTFGKTDKLTYRLVAAPVGMTISPDGIVKWTPQSVAPSGTQRVIIAIKSGTSTQVQQSFTLSVVDPKAPPVVARVEPNPPARGNPEPARRGNPAPVEPARRGNPTPADPPVAKNPAPPSELSTGDARLVAIDATHQVVAGRVPKVAIVGNGGPNPLISVGNDQLLVLNPDGFTMKEMIALPDHYRIIRKRDKTVVAVTSSNPTLHVIDIARGRILQSLKLTGEAWDVALHPTKPITYVSYRDSTTKVPGSRFFVFDETTGQDRNHADYIGMNLAIDPAGRFLYAGYDDTVRPNQEFADLPDNAAPRGPTRGTGPAPKSPVAEFRNLTATGALNVLLRYSLQDPTDPVCLDFRAQTGNSRGGFRLSYDGRQLVNVTNSSTRLLRGWNSEDFEAMPLEYSFGTSTVARADLAFHPLLPLVALVSERGVLMFDQKNGQPVSGMIDAGPVSGSDPRGSQLWFSADGRSLIVCEPSNSLATLHLLPLKFKPEQEQTLAAAAAKRLRQDFPAAANEVRVPLLKFDALQGGNGKEMTIPQVVKACDNSVVVVQCGSRNGTGVIVGSTGYVLTCTHCLEPGDVQVRFRPAAADSDAPVQSAKAEVIRIDGERDLALLKIDAGAPLLPVALAAPDDASAGETVAVISNPSNGKNVYDHTVTTGLVSNARRAIDGASYIQISTAIGPALPSSSAVLNTRGFLVGLISRKDKDRPDFAISSRDLTAFLLSGASFAGDDARFERQWALAADDRVLKATFLETDGQTVKLRRADDQVETSLQLKDLSPGERKLLELLNTASKPVEMIRIGP